MAEKEKDYNEYDKQVMDIDEVEGTDVKINPDYYIHKALFKAQDALTKENLKEGFIQYRQCIEHIEVLCDAANMLDDEYTKKIKDYLNSENYKKLENEQAKSMKLANEKLRLMMKQVFAHKTATFNLKA